MTASITTSELIFGEPDDDLYHPSARGTVGCFIANRVTPWNIFVIVDDDVENRRMTIVTPSIRIFAEQVVLGQDRTTDERIEPDECNNQCVRTRTMWSCVCGSKDRWAEELYQSFRPCWGGEYTTSEISYDNEIGVGGTFVLTTVPPNYLNSINTNYNNKIISADNGTRLNMWSLYLNENPDLEAVITRVQTDDTLTVFMSVKDFECTWKKQLGSFSWIFTNSIPMLAPQIIVEKSDDLRLLMDETISASIHLSRELTHIFKTYKEKPLVKAARD
jgi:hypothetical protein